MANMVQNATHSVGECHGGSGGGHGGGCHGGGHTMWMWYHAELNDTILFQFWTVNNVVMMFFTCLVLFLLAMFFESLKWIRTAVDNRLSAPAAAQNKSAIGGTKEQSNKTRTVARVAQTLLFTLQISISYLLMLAVMSFSIWITVAVCLGAGVGFFLFSSQKAQQQQQRWEESGKRRRSILEARNVAETFTEPIH